MHKKKLILTMEDDVDSEELLKIFLKTQSKEEKEQSELLGIIAEKVSEESCTEQCESCQKYCPASEECMATDENVRCTKCEYLCEACGICELKKKKQVLFRQVNLLIPGTVRRVQKNIINPIATPLITTQFSCLAVRRAACQENP